MNLASGINLNPNVALPSQMIPLTKKNKEWKKKNMDALDRIGTIQYFNNISLVENYEMVKGKFIFSHYLEQDEYADMVHQLTREFEIPNYLRHYDIISQVINTLSGEYQKRPDNFRVKGYDENTTNNYIREKSRLLFDYVKNDIEKEVNLRLAGMGLDPARSDFQSPEEEQQYAQQVDQQRQIMTPPEIEKYMKYSWQDTAEIWGQYQLELDKQRFNLPSKERIEFEDMLIADRCFRHFYLTGAGYDQETWNPINTFFHMSPDVPEIENGDYAGRVLYLTIADVIDRYGYLMKKRQLQDLEIADDTGTKGGGVNAYGIQHGAHIPYEGFQEGKLMQDTFGFNPSWKGTIPTLSDDFFTESAHNPAQLGAKGYVKTIEGYWKSQKKIGKVTYIDPETGIITKGLVDETFVMPEGFVEMDSSFYSTGDDVNTIVWTWVNEVWRGIKICKYGTQLKDDMYIAVEPMPFQFRGDTNPYFAKLPVCGHIFNNRNGRSMALVDLMKPFQIGYNVGANQLYQIMQREVGRFLVMDVNMLTNIKDWGGDNSYEKFILVAKSLGVTFVDTSPQNMKGANANNSMPKEVDLDESSRMLSRMKIMEFFEQRALSQVGITPQRLGNTQASETATGVEQAVAMSYAQTESYFTRFSDYKKRTLKMNLDIAQYVQSQEKDITVSYVKSDMSRAFHKINGTDLLLSDLSVYVTNSQEDIRQLEALRNLFLTNNNTGASPVDLATVITTNSPAEIKAQLQIASDRNEQKYQQQMELEQQKIQTQKEISQAEMEFEAEQNQLDRESEEKQEYIRSFINQKDNNADDDGDGVADLLEYDKLSLAVQAETSKQQLEREKLSLEKQKSLAENRARLAEINLKQQELETRERIEREKVKVAKINKNKYDSKPKAKKKK